MKPVPFLYLECYISLMVQENGDMYGVVSSQYWFVTFHRYCDIYVIVLLPNECYYYYGKNLLCFSIVTCMYFVIHVLILFFPHIA